MKRLLAACAATALLSTVPAHAADPLPAQKAQQERMTQCNKEAEGQTGDARKAFMQHCLSAMPTATTAQQERMKSCNQAAGDKKGDERKAFMKSCLST